MTTLLNGLWQGALLFALVCVMIKMVPRLNAATRYAIWWITLLTVVVLMLRPLIPVSSSRSAETVGAVSLDNALPALSPVREVPPHGSMAAEAVAGTAGAKPLSTVDGPGSWFPIRMTARTAAMIVAPIWILASALLLARLMISYRSLRRLKDRAEPASEQLQGRLDRLRSRAGIARRARLLALDRVRAPMALGLIDPVILIPQSLPERMAEADFNHIALHELAHLRRYDDWMNFLQQLLIALLPIQPVLFWIGRELTLERETACDDWVIAETGTPKAYAASLTRVAELTLWARCGMLASGAAGHPSQLYRRVARLVDKRRNIAPRISAIPLGLAVAAIIALGCGTMKSPQVVAQADPAQPSANGQSVPASEEPQDPGMAQEPIHAQEPAAPQDSRSTQPAAPGSLAQSFAVQPGDRLIVDIDRGNIDLTGRDEQNVRIAVTVTDADPAKFFKGHPIQMIKAGREVRVESTGGGSEDSNVQIEYVISVPASFTVQIRDRAGNIKTAALHTTLDEKTDAGNITAEDCGGSAQAVTDAGNIKIENEVGTFNGQTRAGNIVANGCDGTLSLDAANGNVDLKRDGGTLDSHSGAGNIEALDCTAALQAKVGMGNLDIRGFKGPSVQANTGAGNVSAELMRQPKADCEFHSGMGNVELRLIKTIAANLDASTGMGRLDSDFPMGPINGGGPALLVKSGMGNVRIAKR